MKRLSLALAAIGLSVGAFAALPAATDPTIVSVPQLPGGFFIGGTGFYLQPSDSNGDLDYAAVSNSTSGTFFASSLKNVDPGYDWGWGVNVGYIFPNTGNDVNLSYFQLDTSDTANTNGAVFGTLVPAPQVIIPYSIGTGFQFGSAKAEYDLDQIDLTAGQYIDIGCRLVMHPFAGLRWTQLDRQLDSNYSGPVGAGSTIVTNLASVQEKSNFEGIGPIAGLDASYYVGMGFGVVGHFDSALLIGNINSSTDELLSNIVTVNGTVTQTITGNFAASASNTRRIVPVMDGKLGLNYTYVFNNSANSDLTLEGGWMVSNYFNAVDRLIVANNLAFSTSTIVGRNTSDVGLNGPYVSLVFHA